MMTVRYHARARRGIPPLADLYVPRAATGASVVLVHGGAFVIGSRRMTSMRYLASRLSASGIAVCAIDYRLRFRGGGLAEATDDVCDALAFWSAYAGRAGLDDRAVSLVGLSAGATLALLAAARDRSPPVHRLACCFGLYELDDPARPLVQLLMRLVRAPASLAAGQPAVPTLLLHGSADGLVPVGQAHRLAARREALGLPTKLVVYPGAPHAFFRGPSATAEAGVRELLAHVGARAGSHA